MNLFLRRLAESFCHLLRTDNDRLILPADRRLDLLAAVDRAYNHLIWVLVFLQNSLFLFFDLHSRNFRLGLTGAKGRTSGVILQK